MCYKNFLLMMLLLLNITNCYSGGCLGKCLVGDLLSISTVLRKKLYPKIVTYIHRFARYIDSSWIPSIDERNNVCLRLHHVLFCESCTRITLSPNEITLFERMQRDPEFITLFKRMNYVTKILLIEGDITISPLLAERIVDPAVEIKSSRFPGLS